MPSNVVSTHAISVYAGLFIFVLGTLGNLLSIRFLWRNRRNPCAFIFLVSSLVNCLVLFYGLLTRILSIGFDLDWSQTNRIWCKTRVAFTEAGFLISITCVCLASIDRFLVSSRNENYRKLSRLSLTRLAVIIVIIFWMCHTAPYLYYTDLFINPKTGLTSCLFIVSKTYSSYLTYVALPLYLGFIPTTTLTTTGFMTYRNMNKVQILRQRQLIQRQLTSMMLLQIPIILLSTLPFIIFTEYLVITQTKSKSTNQQDIENLLLNLFTLTFYIPFACPFFVFFASSKTFRKETKEFISFHRFTLLRTNRIQPRPRVVHTSSRPATINID